MSALALKEESGSLVFNTFSFIGGVEGGSTTLNILLTLCSGPLPTVLEEPNEIAGI